MAKDALATLEEKVHQAAQKLGELKSENLVLSDKVAELEERLAASAEGGDDAWASEREEVRERVEALVATLERLLEE
ncbi:MAG TPA: cell division protein ZapB [Thermoanaerobaculia bacterium]|nr:cell division protein ZapB [Thermoanaerobaculia bacterium]